MKTFFLFILILISFNGYSQTENHWIKTYIKTDEGFIAVNTLDESKPTTWVLDNNNNEHVVNIQNSYPDSVRITLSYNEFLTLKALVQINEKASSETITETMEAIMKRIKYFNK